MTARLNAWQNKVQETEKTEVRKPRSPNKITNVKAAVWQPKNSPTKIESAKPAVFKAETKPSPVRADHQAVTESVKLPQPQLVKVDKAQKNKRKSFEPTSQSVHMRMAAWETRTNQVCVAFKSA